MSVGERDNAVAGVELAKSSLRAGDVRAEYVEWDCSAHSVGPFEVGHPALDLDGIRLVEKLDSHTFTLRQSDSAGRIGDENDGLFNPIMIVVKPLVERRAA